MIAAGSRLGPYEILSPLGAGGMGEVYRARDTRLNRDVAIKILPPHVAHHPTRRARFEREAKAASRLNHPHICAVYDIGEQDGAAFLVMEYIEGRSLDKQLLHGPLPFDSALESGIQIADALDAAHRAGLIHRDLKPANVMLTDRGIKLLDFGVAKFVDDSAAADHPDTTATQLTQEHAIVGTVHYMAPEQLEGRKVDARADLFALGAMLHEMITGRKVFEGASSASVAAAVLTVEPPPVSATAARVGITPFRLDHLVKRLLAKDPDARWQTARDVMYELRALRESDPQGGADRLPSPLTRRLRAISVVGLVLLAGGVAGWLLHSSTAAPQPTAAAVVFQVDAPEGTRLNPEFGVLAVSPDDQMIAFLAGPEGGASQIYVRRIDSVTTRLLPGTEGAQGPFWSPDSTSLGFYANNSRELKRVGLDGRSPVVVAQVPRTNFGITPAAFWAADDTIVFGGPHGLFRVKATGGTPEVVTTADTSAGERAYTLPSPLSNGRFAYIVSRNTGDEVRLWGVDSAHTTNLSAIHSNVVFAGGYVIYRQGESLVAQAFDERALRLEGKPVSLANNVQYNPASGRTVFGASADALAYRLELPRKLVWYDRAGGVVGAIGETGREWNPAIAPDGSRRVAVDHYDPPTGSFSVRTIDENGHVRTLTHSARARFAVWSPDSRWIAYWTLGPSGHELRRTTAAGDGRDELVSGGNGGRPLDWSADGRYLVFSRNGTNELSALPLGAERPSIKIADVVGNAKARVSPDGHWIAYSSGQNDAENVWLQPFPSGGARIRISPDGGSDPSWRADGKELFYLGLNGALMAVPIQPGAKLITGEPRALFPIDIRGRAVHAHLYAALPDGQRFVVNAPVPSGDRITVVLHWRSLVGQ